MRLAPSAAGRLLATGCVLALATCAHPDPGRNAAAAAMQAPANVPLATQPTVGQQISAVADNKVVLEFPPGGAAVNGGNTAQLDLAARLFRDVGPTVMFVSGHSDARGDEYNNLLLSARRAQVVKEGLVARGIPAKRLLLQAFGTSDPINTGDRDAAGNRCVVITWRLL